MSITVISLVILIISGLIFILKKRKPKKPWGFASEKTDFKNERQETFLEEEMPIKPEPINCQKASFKAAPEEFFYIDCCGKPNKGEGFQSWEKRAPVSIDINKPFFGMELLNEEGNQDC